MAWDQCKVEVVSHVENKKNREGMSARQAIKALSIESGIPVRTIERWVWPGNAVNNGGNKKPLTPDEFWRSIARKLKNINVQIIRQGDLYADVERETYSILIEEHNRLTDHILAFSDIVRSRFVCDENEVSSGKENG